MLWYNVYLRPNGRTVVGMPHPSRHEAQWAVSGYSKLLYRLRVTWRVA
jgi:hypothetical protein